MGGQSSIEPEKPSSDTFVEQFKVITKEVATLTDILTKLGQTRLFSATVEQHLGETFSRIENQVAALQAQAQNDPLLATQLKELNQSFLNIEWDVSDFKTAPNWSKVPSVIKHIRMVMGGWENFSPAAPAIKIATPRGNERAAIKTQVRELEVKIRHIDNTLSHYN